MSTMLKIAKQMQDEYERLSDFLKRFDGYNSSDPQQSRAVLTTPVLIVGTQNHGHFELDHADIIDHLRAMKTKLEAELKDLTLLGENVKGLRTQGKRTPQD